MTFCQVLLLVCDSLSCFCVSLCQNVLFFGLIFPFYPLLSVKNIQKASHLYSH